MGGAEFGTERPYFGRFRQFIQIDHCCDLRNKLHDSVALPCGADKSNAGDARGYFCHVTRHITCSWILIIASDLH